MRLFHFYLFYFILLGCLPLTTSAETFTLGKNYKLLLKPYPSTHNKNNVEVIEFFSFGCPACYKIEPELQIWLITKPKIAIFDRVPAVFHEEWYPLAKAFYVSKNLHIANRMVMPLFKAVQEDHLDANKETLAFIFQKQGIQRDNFIGVYEFSPGIDAQIAKGAELMRQYSIIQIPTFVIDNVYQTDLAMANGDPKELIKIINYLIAQAALQKTKK